MYFKSPSRQQSRQRGLCRPFRHRHALSASRIRKESMDVNRAKETFDATKLQLEELDQRLQEDIERIEADFVPDEESIQEVLVKAKSSDMTLEFFGLVWMPYRRDARGQLSPDWV